MAVTTREQNKLRVLELVNRNGGVTAAEIADETKLSRATVSELLRDLESEDLVARKTSHETGSARGRPPTLIVPAGPGRYVVSLDIGHFRLRRALFERSGKVVKNPAPFTHVLELLPFGDVVAHIRASVEELLSDTTHGDGDIRGVAVSLPAAIDKTGAVANGREFKWPSEPRLVIAEKIRDLVGEAPIVVSNDVNACLRGEHRMGAAQGASNVVFVKATTGFGCAFLSNGLFHEGHNGIAGEISHRLVTDKFADDAVLPECSICGHRGCLRNLASSEAILRDARARRQKSGIGPDDDSRLGIAEVIDRALKEDERACKEALQQAGKYLGMALRQMLQDWDPELILIGGVLSKAGKILLDEVNSEVHEDAKRYPSREKRIALVEDYEMSALYGGYALVQEALARQTAAGRH